MLVELTSAAQSDVVDAALAYEIERPSLGFRFEAELDRALSAIAENPLQFAVVQDEVRRALLRVFPFSVFFIVLEERVRVFAVLHQHQHPDSWCCAPRRLTAQTRVSVQVGGGGGRDQTASPIAW